jgi:hypothetical protein
MPAIVLPGRLVGGLDVVPLGEILGGRGLRPPLAAAAGLRRALPALSGLTEPGLPGPAALVSWIHLAAGAYIFGMLPQNTYVFTSLADLWPLMANSPF